MEIQEIRRLQIGEFIEINGETYEIIQIRADALPFPSNDPPIRQYHSIFLRNVKSTEMLPQSELMLFDDDNEIRFNESRALRETDIIKK